MASLPARILAYLFVGILCATGPMMLLFAAGTGVERAIFVRSSFSTDGVIVGLSPVRPYRSNKSWYPVFRFTASDGQSYTVTSNVGERASSFKAGDIVRVLYEQDHPENAHIDTIFQLWAPQIIVGSVGMGFSVIPLLIFLRRRRSIEG